MTKKRVIPLYVKFLYVSVFAAVLAMFAYSMYQKHKSSAPLPATSISDPVKVEGKIVPVKPPVR